MYHIISSSESLIALGKTLSLVDYPFSDTDGIAVYAELTAEKHVISVHYQEDGWHVSAPTVAAADMIYRHFRDWMISLPH